MSKITSVADAVQLFQNGDVVAVTGYGTNGFKWIRWSPGMEIRQVTSKVALGLCH